MFTESRIAIIGSAPIPCLSRTKEKITQYPLLIAVDGGANHCYQMGIQPNLIIGDLDSIDPLVQKAFHHLPLIQHPIEKNHTDMELALALAFHPKTEKITIFGALGGRIDHTLGNLMLLARYPGKVFLESDSELFFVVPGFVEIPTQPGQTISLIPLNGPAKGITTQGLKWILQEGILDRNFIGISNKATATSVNISVKEGDLLCCLNFDPSPITTESP